MKSFSNSYRIDAIKHAVATLAVYSKWYARYTLFLGCRCSIRWFGALDRKIIWINTSIGHGHGSDENHLLFWLFFALSHGRLICLATASVPDMCHVPCHAHVNDNKYRRSDYRFWCNRHLFDDPSECKISSALFLHRMTNGSAYVSLSGSIQLRVHSKQWSKHDINWSRWKAPVLHARLNCFIFFSVPNKKYDIWRCICIH